MTKLSALFKRYTRYAAFLLVALTHFGCTPSTQLTATWKSPNVSKQYTNVFIVALMPSLASRIATEGYLGQYLEKGGVRVTLESTVLPPNTDFTNDATKQQIIAQMKANGCDGILAISILDKQTSTTYVPGTMTYAPMGFWGAYGAWGIAATPGYYETDVTYYMAANLYDINTDELIWTGQTTTTDPGNIQNEANQYAQLIVGKMQAAGVVPSPQTTKK